MRQIADAEIRSVVTDRLRSAGASFTLVFGSRARGDHRASSDLDVAAWWPIDAPNRAGDRDEGPRAWDLDVAQHIASAERLRAPDSNADAIRLLGEHEVIERDLAASLGHAVGLRNVLVHQWATVDDAIVITALDRLDEFDRFVGDVSAWLLQHDG